MSQLLIQKYLNELSDVRQISGTGRETAIREPFKDLLKHWGRSRELKFVPEYEIETPARDRAKPVILNASAELTLGLGTPGHGSLPAPKR